MKKLLLSLAMVLGFVAVNAATVTIDPAAWSGKWTGDGNGFTATVEGYTLTLDKAGSGQDLVVPNDYSIRVYQGATLTITAPSGVAMKEITFTVDQNSKLAAADQVTYSAGWTLTGTPSTTQGSTFGAASEGLGSFMMTAGKQARIAKIVISDEEGGSTVDPVDPDPVDPDPVDPDPVTPGVEGEITVETPFTQFTNFSGGDNTVGGYTFVFDKTTGTTAPQVYNEYLRLYAKNTITISGVKVSKVVFTFAEDNVYRYTTFTPSTGAYTAAQAAGDTELTWTGDATSVTFTVGDKAVYGEDGDTKAGQIRIAKITVYGEAGETPVDPDPVDPDPVDPDPVDPADGVVLANPFANLTVPGVSNVSGYTVDIEKLSNGTTNPTVNTKGELRLYSNNTFTVSGTKVTKVVFTFTADNKYRYTEFTPSTGAWTKAQAAGDTELTWTGDATTVTFTVGEKATMGDDGADRAGQIRIEKITIYGEPGEGGDVTPTPQGDKYIKTTTLTSGSYVFVCEGLLATPAAESNTYGRMTLVDATMDGADVVTVEKNAFTLDVADGKVTIKDSYGRYYGMDNEHLTSFQFYTELNEGCYYTYEFVGETIKLYNELNPACIVSQTKGTNGTWYTNLAPADAPEEFNLPVLYKKADPSAIFEVIANEDAPVVYYNLQGVQVENPSNGVFIRRQGNKTTKVLVK